MVSLRLPLLVTIGIVHHGPGYMPKFVGPSGAHGLDARVRRAGELTSAHAKAGANDQVIKGNADGSYQAC